MKYYNKLNKYELGFTLIESVVVIGIISILSAVILFSITQYINKGKDANVQGNLAILVPAGEVFYNANGSSYDGFCSSSVVLNAVNQISKPQSPDCSTGICCSVKSTNDAWAACAQKFTDNTKAYCVDSRGVKKEADNTLYCVNQIGQGLVSQCP